MLTEMQDASLTLSAVVSEAGAGLERSKQRSTVSGAGTRRRRQGSVVMMERLEALQEEFTQLREQARRSQPASPQRPS